MAYLEALRGDVSSIGSQSPLPAAIRPGRSISGNIVIEMRRLRACTDIIPDWRDLARRSLQPNIFYEPDLALAAAQHLVGADLLQAILVWDQPTAGGQRLLLGLFPVKVPGSLLPFQQLRGMGNSYFASGIPLIDCDAVAEVMTALFGWLGTADAPGASYLLPLIDLDGAFAKALASCAAATGRPLAIIGRHQRNGLIRSGSDQDASLRTARLERLKTLRRAIAISGRPRIAEAVDGRALRDAVEVFLAIEASGRRGRAGTAMMMQTRTATFLRAATRGLSQARHCRIMTLMQGDVPIAAAVLYESGTKAWLVDVVSDDAFSRYSPEEFLRLAIVERQYGHGKIAVTEQCNAVAQPVSDGIWPALVSVGDILVSPRGAGRPVSIAARSHVSLTRRTGLLVRRLVSRFESGN